MASSSPFWHPFANMGEPPESRLSIVRGEGACVYDAEGREYVDAIASLWYCNVGHGRAELADAAREQMRTLAAYQTFELYTSPPVAELAERVAGLVPVAGARVFFTSGGSESVDTAVKLARAYWVAAGRPDKNVVLSRRLAYHGMNVYGTSLGGIPANRAGYEPLVSLTEQVPWDDAGALREAIERIGPERVAAFFCEPVIGAGGVVHPPPGYLAEVEAICREHDVLFVVDEVITGFGRLGEWFASGRFGLAPDIVTVAKGITSGYVPLGAVIAGERVAEPFWRPGTDAVFRHGYTYSGHTTACAVALANLDILERERLVERVRELEPLLASALHPLASHPLVAEVRAGLGLLAAVEIRAEALVERPGLVAQLAAEVRRQGVLTRGLRGVALQVSPPFVVSEEQLGLIAEAFEAALDAVS